jgi:hypothetical protein
MLAADDYTLRHLATHLHAAGRQDRLYRLLLSNPAWMEAKFRRLGDDTAYGADLALAISDYADPLDPAGLALLVQLHTARQVLHGRATLYEDTDLQTLVWLDRQSEALGSVRLRPEPAQVVTGLLAVYDVLRRRGQSTLALLGEALATARQVEGAKDQAQALIAVVRALLQARDRRVDEVLAEAEAAARRIEEGQVRQRVLGDLAGLLVEQGRYDQVLALIQAQPGQEAWSIPTEAREELLDHLVGAGRFDEAAAVGRGFHYAPKRAGALVRVATAWARMPEGGGRSKSEALMAEAEQAARTTEHYESRYKTLEQVALSAVEAGCFAIAGNFLHLLDDYWEQVLLWPVVGLALARVGDPAAPALFGEAIRRARRFGNPMARIAMLRKLALALSQAGDERAGNVVDEALAAARQGPYKSPEASDLFKMAQVLYQLGDERTETVFDEAFTAACAEKDERQRAKQLKDCALAMLEAGAVGASVALDEACQAAADIWYEEDRSNAVSDLIRALVQADLLGEAKATALAMDAELEFQGWWAREALQRSTVLLEAGQYGQVEHVVRSIPAKSNERDVALSRLARALAAADHGEWSLQVTRTIEHDQLETLREVSLLLAWAGNPRAEAAFVEVQELAWSERDRQTEWRAVHAIGQVLAWAGDPRTKVMFRQAEEAARARVSSVRLDQVAAAMARAGVSRADDLFSEARELADAVLPDEPRGNILWKLSRTMLEAERWHEAEQTALAIPLGESFAFEGGDKIHADEKRAGALRDVVAAMAQAGQFDDARRVARSINNSLFRTMALADVIEALARVGDSRAEEILREVRSSAQLSWEEDYYSRKQQIELARAFAATGHLREAEAIGSSFGNGFYAPDGGVVYRNAVRAMARDGQMDEAEALARSIQDESSRLGALRELTAMRASALVADGSYDEAMALIRAIQDRRLRDQALDDLADMLVAAGRFAQALDTLRPLKLDEFVQWLAESVPTLEVHQAGLSVTAMEAALAVAGWTRATWRALDTALATAV